MSENIHIEHNCPKGNTELTFIYIAFLPARYVCAACGYTKKDPND